jgi:hypothetical protein
MSSAGMTAAGVATTNELKKNCTARVDAFMIGLKISVVAGTQGVRSLSTGVSGRRSSPHAPGKHDYLIRDCAAP